MILQNAVVDDHAIVMDGFVTAHAHVAGNAAITASSVTRAWPHIEGFASVYGDVCGAVFVKGTAVILPGVAINNPTKDSFVVENNKVTVERNFYRLNGIPQNPKKQETKRKRRSEVER